LASFLIPGREAQQLFHFLHFLSPTCLLTYMD
jgi:hypothetical protein